jgi:hypothetical protein
VTKVDYRNPTRPALLLLTGTEDRICPPSVNKANFKKQQKHRPRQSTRSTPAGALTPVRTAGKKSPTSRWTGRVATPKSGGYAAFVKEVRLTSHLRTDSADRDLAIGDST